MQALICLHSLAVRTPPSHGGIRGSSPLGGATFSAKPNCFSGWLRTLSPGVTRYSARRKIRYSVAGLPPAPCESPWRRRLQFVYELLFLFVSNISNFTR